MSRLIFTTSFILITSLLYTLPLKAAVVEGELRRWHRVAITFDGPLLCENSADNPFLNYRLQVTLSHGSLSFSIPGFFAADGNAGESSASCGDKWRVYFTPPRSGTWTYTAEFHAGPEIAVSTLPGTPVSFDGETGSFAVGPTDKTGNDFRAKGMLVYSGKRYMKFQETGEPFLMGGSASPENLLAYKDFDSTYTDAGPTNDDIHSFLPHVADWNPGDPVWKGTKGKGIIGGLNYLASEGMNIQFMLTFTEGGDGDDVWPWTGPVNYLEYDVSKLAQWEIVFSHMDHIGILQHLVLQERENDQYLDMGDLGMTRKLYFRELIARFGHHLGLIWNIGEENTNTDAQRKSHATYIKSVDPYDHLLIAHTYAFDKPIVYGPLLGYPDFDGASMHISNYGFIDDDFLEWSFRSDTSGRRWVLFLSEIGPVTEGVLPDDVDPDHDIPRQMYWNVLFHGGSGAEWYFGRNYPNNDVNCEDFRSRTIMWQQTRIAMDFWKLIPFEKMKSRDDLVSRWQTWCYALGNKLYLVNLPNGDDTQLTIGAGGNYRLAWFDPVNGGPIIDAGTFNMAGPGNFTVDNPPGTGDWVAIVVKAGLFPRLEAQIATSDNLHLIPNPADQLLQISWESPLEEAKLEIFDLMGRLMQSTQVQGLSVVLSIQGMPAGTYVCRVSGQNSVVRTEKFMVRH